MSIDREQLQVLINELLENSLSAEGYRQLESILNSSPEARQVYLDQMQLESMLFEFFEPSSKPTIPLIDSFSTPNNPSVA